MSLELTAHHDAPIKANVPIPQSQPERLAAIAALRGLGECEVEQASVLELACGDGSNLLPLAERYPHGKFLGIDPSREQIAQARSEAQALGLANVEFRQQRVVELGDELGLFDYIIADGVYSWSDAATRERLLALCHDHLAPRGIAYINYHAYPGWHVHELFSSLMRFQARQSRTAAQRVAAGRMVIEFLKASLPGNEHPYGALLRQELDRVSAQGDPYLLYNHLNDAAGAVYLREFLAHARRHQLQYLGDGTLGTRYTDSLAGPLETELHSVVSDPFEREQIRDILHNKAHRQTLLCHDAVAIEPSLATSRLSALYLEALLRPENPQASIESTSVDNFVAPGGLSVATAVPAIKAALTQLGSSWPGYVKFDELVANACQRVARRVPEATESDPAAPPDAKRVEDNLLQCCAAGVIQIHGRPNPFVTVVGDRPTVSPLARRQAARGATVTNRKHESISVEPFDRHVMNLADESRSVSQLVEHLSALAASGGLMAVENNQPVAPERVPRFLADSLAQALKRLADNACLIA